MRVCCTYHVSMLIIGEPLPEVTWQKDNKKIKSKKDKRFAVNWITEENKNVLEIKDARIEDSGAYTVNATNEAGTVSSTVVVAVTATVIEEPETAVNVATVGESLVQEASPSALIVKPEISLNPDPVSIEEGETIKLSCTIQGSHL